MARETSHESHRKPALIGAVLADRYTVQKIIGQGGMATVYEALDSRHDRRVALKVFHSDLAATVGEDRFLREIRITAGLNHPHILPLLDSGVSHGLLYYVMPRVTGGSLRDLLASGARIPLEAVVRIAREVASALEYAHRRGVVHRDIKPENILFSEGLAVVGDFGIARALDAGPRPKMTRTGMAVGTLGYMSPEQALGTADLDARTDVYSLGSVIYEMLVGETPASWPGPEDVRLGRLDDVPPEHRRRLDTLPGRVEQVLARALALRPADRFSRPGELAEAIVAASERTTSFSDDQVKELLDRAAELQAREPERVPEGGLTIGAVEQVAAQVGIPPEHVREAARQLERREPGALSPQAEKLWLKPRRDKWDQVVVDGTLEGEVPESAYPAMVEEIQSRLEIVGHASLLAGSMTWSPATQAEGSRRVLVYVTAREGQSRVCVEEKYEIAGFKRAFLPLGALLGIALAAIIGGLLGLPDGVLIPGAALGLIGAVWSVIQFEANTRRPELEELTNRLLEMANGAIRTQSNAPFHGTNSHPVPRPEGPPPDIVQPEDSENPS